MRVPLVLLAAACSCLAASQTIAEKTQGLTPRPGLIESYLDAKAGKVLLKFPGPTDGDRLGQYLYTDTLATGLGANDLGLDRGEPGRTVILNVRLLGNKVLFEAPNYAFRATSTNLDEQRATAEAFATSVVWATPVVARDPDGAVLIDLTDFIVRDAHGIASSLERQGPYTLDKDRSALNPAMCKAFPDNLEFEALLTFRSARPGALVRQHAPDPEYVTLAQRHSLVRLPDGNYRPRKFDPRSGSFAVTYLDFSAPLGESMLRKWVVRHRLEPDPTITTSSDTRPVKKPIVYYVDRGVPEPIRTALITGGNYWKRAFEAAGWRDAFRVELMPEGLDPMDVRYNVIHWTNRSTRGWAFGSTVVDPRTGEIVRGVVNLDSQRARQDVLLFESLLGVDESGKGTPNDPIRVALSRIRQLSAHEIGHTLGFQHNFASSVNGRASVMDYPAPLIKLNASGELDLSNAYAPGVGDWDIQMVRYAYGWIPGASEDAELERILKDGLGKGLLFLADAEADEATGADPRAHRWDNGTDPIASLRHAMQVRKVAMAKFGERNLRLGQPLSNLELVFGPLYFFHRYDVDAAAKMLGGVYLSYAVRGDGQTPQQPVPVAQQRAALNALIECLKPAFLETLPAIAKLLGNRANGMPASREEFDKRTPFVFDTTSAAMAGADLVLSKLLDPGRSARLVELSARGQQAIPLEEVFSTLIDALVGQPAGTPMHKEIGWGVQHLFALRLMDLAADEGAHPGVRSRASAALRVMASAEASLVESDRTGHAAELTDTIRRFLARPAGEWKRPVFPSALPGQPIGGW